MTKTYKAKVIKALNSGHLVSSKSAQEKFGTPHLSQIIHTLRAEGYEIRKSSVYRPFYGIDTVYYTLLLHNAIPNGTLVYKLDDAFNHYKVLKKCSPQYYLLEGLAGTGGVKVLVSRAGFAVIPEVQCSGRRE